jgi:DNA repair ATPase RecN
MLSDLESKLQTLKRIIEDNDKKVKRITDYQKSLRKKVKTLNNNIKRIKEMENK